MSNKNTLDPYSDKNIVKIIDFLQSVSCDQVVLLAFPILLLYNWLFYDETGIGVNFRI